ncbi:hypothetical protein RM844_18020 [Streptomyces sp. DSM 44915]|uniref:Integral membrane protein n=1 Tax=Streptomyces chisholmiae TaxID=3075540 RepID=A0ABU2JTW0_9ACTN|nr:hypothetical protein [Streptomyces sp. DSM 44915]MDT0268183.1 hypothetical protein [Streptomyces sp. DSM 44915]
MGSLLAWTRVEGHSLMAGDADGVRGTSGDGLWTLILGLVAVALFLAARFARKPVLNAVGVVPGLIAAGIAALNIANPDRLARARLEEEMSLTDAQWNQVASSFEFSATIGVFVVLLGALAIVVGGILAVTQLRKG